VAALPEQSRPPLVPGDIDYSEPPATDLETRVRLLEDIIRTQSARQRELEEQISFQSSARANVQPGGAAAAPQPYVVGSDAKMSASWKNGLEIQSANKDYRVHIGGRTQIDGVWLQQSSAFTGAGGVGDADSVNFRRARLRIDGTYGDMQICRRVRLCQQRERQRWLAAGQSVRGQSGKSQCHPRASAH